MSLRRNSGTVILLAVAWVFCLDSRAWAYTDPGSGLLLWQGLAAMGVGLMFGLRRIIRFFRSFGNQKATDQQDQ